MNADYPYVGERWRCRLNIIHFVPVTDSQSIYAWSTPCVNIRVMNPFDFVTDDRLGRTNW